MKHRQIDIVVLNPGGTSMKEKKSKGASKNGPKNVVVMNPAEKGKKYKDRPKKYYGRARGNPEEGSVEERAMQGGKALGSALLAGSGVALLSHGLTKTKMGPKAQAFTLLGTTAATGLGMHLADVAPTAGTALMGAGAGVAMRDLFYAYDLDNKLDDAVNGTNTGTARPATLADEYNDAAWAALTEADRAAAIAAGPRPAALRSGTAAVTLANWRTMTAAQRTAAIGSAPAQGLNAERSVWAQYQS